MRQSIYPANGCNSYVSEVSSSALSRTALSQARQQLSGVPSPSRQQLSGVPSPLFPQQLSGVPVAMSMSLPCTSVSLQAGPCGSAQNTPRRMEVNSTAQGSTAISKHTASRCNIQLHMYFLMSHQIWIVVSYPYAARNLTPPMQIAADFFQLALNKFYKNGQVQNSTRFRDRLSHLAVSCKVCLTIEYLRTILPNP